MAKADVAYNKAEIHDPKRIKAVGKKKALTFFF